MKNTSIISAFPGTGKSYFYNQCKEIRKDLIILDSDSSDFSWIKDENGNNTTTRNPEFPDNYINHIKENIGKADLIFVSSHDIVRQALRDNNIKYMVVYPNIKCKDEYLERYRNRGNTEEFINMMDKNWDKFIDGMANDNGAYFKYSLVSNDYIDRISWLVLLNNPRRK